MSALSPELTKFRSILIKTRFPNANQLNYPALFDSKNVQNEDFIKILDYFFKEYDIGLIKKIRARGYDFVSLEGVDFVNSCFKIMRDYFNIKLNLNSTQFNLKNKFNKQKVICLTTIAEVFIKHKTPGSRRPLTSANATESDASLTKFNPTGQDKAFAFLKTPNKLKFKDDGVPFSRQGNPIVLKDTLEHISFKYESPTSKNLIKNVRPKTAGSFRVSEEKATPSIESLSVEVIKNESNKENVPAKKLNLPRRSISQNNLSTPSKMKNYKKDELAAIANRKEMLLKNFSTPSNLKAKPQAKTAATVSGLPPLGKKLQISTESSSEAAKVEAKSQQLPPKPKPLGYVPNQSLVQEKASIEPNFLSLYNKLSSKEFLKNPTSRKAYDLLLTRIEFLENYDSGPEYHLRILS